MPLRFLHLAGALTALFLLFTSSLPDDWVRDCTNRKENNILIQCHSFVHRGSECTVEYELDERDLEETNRRYGYKKSEWVDTLLQESREFEKRYNGRVKLYLSTDESLYLSYPKDRPDLKETFSRYLLWRKKAFLERHYIARFGDRWLPDYPAIQLWQAGYATSMTD